MFTYLSSKLKLELDITVAGNPAFDAARGTKNRMKRDAQAQGCGTLEHQRDPIPVEVLEVLLQGGTINIYQPFPLVAGFYILFTITFMCRVGEEMFNLRHKDIHLHYNEQGEVEYMTYHPSTPLKMTNGVTPSSNKAIYLYKQAAAVPSENPNVCLIRFYQEILKHLDMLNPSDKPHQRIFQSLKQTIQTIFRNTQQEKLRC